MDNLWDNYISNKNLDEFEDWHSTNLCIKKFDDRVEISFKNTYSVNIFSYEKDNDFYFSFNPRILKEIFGEFTKRHTKLFEKLTIYKDRYKFDYCGHDVQTIRVDRPEAGLIIQKWIDKYRHIILSYDPKDLMIEVSAGFDTRNLSYLWRYNGNKYDIYTKNDPDEVDVALKVIEQLPYDNIYVGEKILNRISLNGGNIISVNSKFNINEHWCQKIANPLYCRKSHHILYGITPYYDKEYLRIKTLKSTDLKYALAHLFTKDNKELYENIPYLSFKRKQVKIDKKFKWFAESILCNWKNFLI